MTGLNNEGRFVLAIRSLSQNIYKRVLPLLPKFCDTAQEIRLRVNRPVAIVCPTLPTPPDFADTARLCRHRPTLQTPPEFTLRYAPLYAPLTLRRASASLTLR